MIRFGRIGFAVLFALYPLAVYAGLRAGEIQWAALTLAAAAGLQAISSRRPVSIVCAAVAGGLAAVSFTADTALPVKFYPVAVNAAWFIFFAASLSGESVIEKLARLKEPELSPAGRRYCRNVTLVWCVFFVINGLIAFDSAVNRTEAWWSLYNGLIAYVLIGCLFAGEWLVRLRIRKRSP